MRITLFIVSLLLTTSPQNPKINSDKGASEMRVSLTLKDVVFSNEANENIPLPSSGILTLAGKGYESLKSEGGILEGKPLALIDFSLPSTEKRLWVIDVETGEILFNDFVSHGKNSGELYATSFSNLNSSYKSSLGFYQTAETYTGKHGYSLRLDGLESGINDNARNRAIVIHGAGYANPDFIEKTGRLGRSLGCPALPEDSAKALIDLIKEKSCLFIYANEFGYLNNSIVLNG